MLCCFCVSSCGFCYLMCHFIELPVLILLIYHDIFSSNVCHFLSKFWTGATSLLSIVPFLSAAAEYLHSIHNVHLMKLVNSKIIFLYSKMNNNDCRPCQQSVWVQHLFAVKSMRWKSRERLCWKKDHGLAACCLLLTTYSALACRSIVAEHLTNENVRWCEIQWTIRVVPSARVQQNIITNNV